MKVKGIFPRKKKIEDFYEIKNVVGSGNYSIVNRGIHKKSDEEVALKIIEKDLVSDFEKENLYTEIEILRTYGDHPNIIKLKEVYEDRKRLILVLEFMKGGELLQHIRRKKFYSEKEASIIIKKVIEAAAYLHKNGVVHRDLKPENLLFSSEDEDSELKIADFGFARYIGEGSLQTPCGSPAYVAPEIVNEQDYNKAVDMWSIGVILYILLCGFPPFYHETTEQIFVKIKEGQFNFPDPYWSKVSSAAKELVSLLLKVDPKERITAEDALLHPWIAASGGEHHLEKMGDSSELKGTSVDKCNERADSKIVKRRRPKKSKRDKEEAKGKSDSSRESTLKREDTSKSKDDSRTSLDKRIEGSLKSKDDIKDDAKSKKANSKHEKTDSTCSFSTDPSDDSWSENNQSFL